MLLREGRFAGRSGLRYDAFVRRAYFAEAASAAKAESGTSSPAKAEARVHTEGRGSEEEQESGSFAPALQSRLCPSHVRLLKPVVRERQETGGWRWNRADMRKRWIVTGAGVAAGAYAGWAYGIAYRTLHPARLPITQTPADHGFDYEGVEFYSADGLRLRGWWIPAAKPRGVAVCLHSYGGNRSEFLPFLPIFQEAGFSVLAFDFRGLGASDGTYTALGLEEPADARGAVRWARARLRGRPMVLFGRSLGGAVALMEAGQNPHIAGVITDSAYVRLDRTLGGLFRHHWRPLRPAARLFTAALLRRKTGLGPEYAAPVESLDLLGARPALVIFGDQDGAVPPPAEAELREAAGPKVQIWVVPGAGHGEVWALAESEYRSRVQDFLAQLTRS